MVPAIDTDDPEDRRSNGRRLVAVLYADMVGYTRLIGLDDVGTLNRIRGLRTEIFDVAVARRGGTIHQTAGDSLLMTFESVVDAFWCAVEIQRQVPIWDCDAEANRRIRLRMGLAVGDTITDGNDLHGDSINVAVRLQSIGRPGSICVSRAVYDQVGDRFVDTFESLGALSLKNISRPVEAFLLQVTDEPEAFPVPLPDFIPELPPTVPGLNSASHRPTIAMLPLRDIGETPIAPYFSEGMMHEVIASLANFRELFVVSSSSTLSLAPEIRSVPNRAARMLGVRYLVTGTVMKSHDQVRISVELTDTETRSVVWSDRYEATEGSVIFLAQDAAANRIAYSLLPHLRNSELRRAVRKPPNVQDAYDLVLQAQHIMYRFGSADDQRARSLLMRAIERDPSYPLAHALLAHWYLFQVGENRTADRSSDRQTALRHSTLALESDPFDSLALAMHGHIQAFLFNRLHDALETFDRATSVSPNSPVAWALSSPTYAYLGEGIEAVRRAEHALRLSPLDPYSHIFSGRLGLAHYVNGSFPEAVHWSRRSLAKEPEFLAVLRHYTASLVAIDHMDEARLAASRILSIDPNFTVSHFIKTYPLVDAKARRDYADRLIKAGLPE